MESNAHVDLTPRELEVLELVVEGLTNDQIARTLALSPRTVQSHVAAATCKTRTWNRTHLAITALRTGLVPLFPAAPMQQIRVNVAMS